MACRQRSLFLTLMTSPRLSLIRLLVPLIAILALRGAAEEQPNFTALQEDYATKAMIVAEMDRIILKEVKIDNLRFPAALDEIRRKGAGNKWATMNFVIRRLPARATTPALADDPFATGDEAGADEDTKTETKQPAPPPERISMSAASISFAGAIDQLCEKAGYRWWIEFNARIPLLVMAPAASMPGKEEDDS
ncbi:hypothetical protein OKA05_26970 [Luteolibacter arcticus]|uniref:Uncharacterized protein n=1 Tax=Luteolibacter arcticus TaxID=1581411 RepID=A0ABT3GRX6_9BACT|nr:hypothetical protein [Luteolibacter arcticus]MCW1926229.1 hypothetical protein [Luteolibacter arcticus]